MIANNKRKDKKIKRGRENNKQKKRERKRKRERGREKKQQAEVTMIEREAHRQKKIDQT